MKRFLDFILFVILIAVIAIANQNFLGFSSANSNKETVTFAPNLMVAKTIYTIDYAKNISGYGGHIPMGIGVDKDNIIKDIKVLSNTETQTFLNQVLQTNIFANWVGKNIADAKTNVDAVSGATMSSEAIIKSINTTINAINGKETIVTDKYNITKTLAILFVGLLGLFSFFAPKKTSKVRPIILATSIFVLGIWQGSMLSIAKISAWLIHGVPDYYLFSLLPVLIISIAIPMITGKNFYCFHVCPFGAAQEIVSLSLKTNIKIKTIKWLSYARVAILCFAFILLVFGIGGYIGFIEPFAAFKPDYAPISAIVIFVTSLIASVFITRPWCKYFCPCGAFLDLFKKK